MTKSNAASKNAAAPNSDDTHKFRSQISTAVIPSVGPDDWSLHEASREVWQQTCAIPIGRGKSGKSTVSRLLVECAKMAGRPLRFSDLDPTNIGLKDTHTDALGPGDAHPVTLHDYTRAEMEKLVEGHESGLMDFGAGNPAFETLLREVNLGRLLKRMNKQLLLFCLLGPHRGDLSQINTFLSLPGLDDAHVVLCLNEGLVPPGREISALDAYAQSKPVLDALDRGARLIRLPRLSAADRIEDLGLTFRDAALGRANIAGKRLGQIDTQITAEWLLRLPKSFEPIEDWMGFAPVESLLSGVEA